MPIEIRELVIKAAIDHNQNNSSSSTSNPEISGANEATINLIVSKVLEIIKEKTER